MLELLIHCCTWNVGDEAPPKDDFKALLGIDGRNVPDIIAIALQETIDLEQWRNVLLRFLAPEDYVLVKSRRVWAIATFLFMKRNLLSAVTNIESEATPLGFGGFLGNKGAVGLRFEICGVNVIIVSAHFHAHEHGQLDRLNDYHDTLEAQTFRDEDVHRILDHDYVFWLGDLNFRLEGINIQKVKENIDRRNFEYLLKYDQLMMAKERSLIFGDFNEGKIEFAPTFKYDKMTDVYDSSEKNRVPAWTDRILYMSHRDFMIDHHLNKNSKNNPFRIQKLSRREHTRGTPSDVESRSTNERFDALRKPEIVLLKYTALEQYKSSDHRPVIGLFKFSVPSHWYSLPVKFMEPSCTSYSMKNPLRFIYQLSKCPELLKFADEKSRRICKPVVNQSPIIQNLLLSVDRLVLTDSETPSSQVSTQLLGEHVVPDKLEKRYRDEIRVYPGDFVDLENDYLSVATGKLIQKTENNDEIYSGQISIKIIRNFVGRSVLLAFNSFSKNCPQGYTSEFMIEE